MSRDRCLRLERRKSRSGEFAGEVTRYIGKEADARGGSILMQVIPHLWVGDDLILQVIS